MNYNMPLRCLLYVGRAYEQLVDKKAIRECIERGILSDYLKRKGSEAEEVERARKLFGI